MNDKNKIGLYIMIIIIAFISIAHLTNSIYLKYENNKTIEENQKKVEEYKNKLEERRKEKNSRLKNPEKEFQSDNVQLEIEQIIENSNSEITNNFREMKYGLILSLICILPALIYKLIVKFAQIDDSFSNYSGTILGIDFIVSAVLFIYDIISKLDNVEKYKNLSNMYEQLLNVINKISMIFS